MNVKTVCTLLARSRLMPPDEVKALHRRWRAEAKDARHDLRRFRKWLVARHYVTPYQAKLLVRGQADGLVLHRYQVLERVGKGRIAGVYKAVHPSGQVVAIKVLPPSKAQDARLVARFRREAALGKRLHHPNVVRIFQKGETKGLHFLVMEYLEGETLEAVLRRRGKLAPNEALRLIYQALLGLQHLHEHGLVHRDLEPGNLMLVPAAGDGPTTGCTVKILDVGQARDLGEAGDAPPEPVTREGELLGTAAYLAPEQAHDPHRADIRADLYSLGCVLYHALAGQPPFPDDNVLRQVQRHAQEAPQPLSAFRSEVPEDLQAIVDGLLAKDPNQRYPTPRRAAEAIEKVLAGGHAPPPAPAQPHLEAFLQWLQKDSTDDIPPAPRPARKRSRSSAKRRPAPPSPSPAPAPPPAPELGLTAAQLMPQSNRDWLLVVTGVGLVLAVEVFAMLLWLLTR
jgi:eukaryotic-like serine/threonine-protein kinase